MSGSSLDGLDVVYVQLHVSSGKWEYEIIQTSCHPYTGSWQQRLAGAPDLSAREYQLLHTEYGHYLGQQVNQFIESSGLHYQVQLIVSHGHTSFHLPGQGMTAQLGDGAAVAAETGINVVSDLRAMDLALGGQGAPIVPIGEKLLWNGYEWFLNLGGIANISRATPSFSAFDVCSANRVLNRLSEQAGRSYDEGGALAAGGTVDITLLDRLNALPYYAEPYPKSLANEFGTDIVYPIVEAAGLPVSDALRTYVEHIAIQISRAVEVLGGAAAQKMLVTGGGAHNTFLIDRLKTLLTPLGIEVVIPDAALIDYKEALVMALIGVLRWREENNVLASVTGARRNSIGGAVWIGQEG